MGTECSERGLYDVYSFSIWLTILLVLQWVDDLADAGANQYTFHLEATSKFNSLVPRSPDVVPRPAFHGLQGSLYCSLIPSSNTGGG